MIKGRRNQGKIRTEVEELNGSEEAEEGIVENGKKPLEKEYVEVKQGRNLKLVKHLVRKKKRRRGRIT